ncbi:MAG: general secretion pathway protein L [Halioglobus sp.]|jgi:general secretion pathway protein L
MLQSGQNWDLFGYDVRQLYKSWRAAWRDFLWGDDSPIKARLDEVLSVKNHSGKDEYFHAGQRVIKPEVEHDVAVDCEAVILPDSMVLLKILTLPKAAETDLELVMAMEVTANSPFPESDTSNGWRIVSRDENNVTVQLAIVSLSAVMSYLGQKYACHDPHAREVWADIDKTIVVLSGFGERKRQQHYNKRLVRFVIGIAYSVLVLVIIFGGAAGFKYLQLNQLRSLSAEVQLRASDAIKMRSAIVRANETVAAVNALAAQRPNPHYELARLSSLLGDDAFLLQLSVQGTALDMRGVADDAAVVVQQLTDEPAFSDVMAPQAITKYFNTEQEQFFLNIKLLGEQERISPEQAMDGAPAK